MHAMPNSTKTIKRKYDIITAKVTKDVIREQNADPDMDSVC